MAEAAVQPTVRFLPGSCSPRAANPARRTPRDESRATNPARRTPGLKGVQAMLGHARAKPSGFLKLTHPA